MALKGTTGNIFIDFAIASKWEWNYLKAQNRLELAHKEAINVWINNSEELVVSFNGSSLIKINMQLINRNLSVAMIDSVVDNVY